MSLKSKFGTVKGAETEGVWIDILTNDDGSVCRFKIRRSGRLNKEYGKSLEKATKPYRKMSDDIDPATDYKIWRKVICESIVTDWENVQIEEGINLEFSLVNLDKVLTDLPDLQDLIREKAADIETFQGEQQEAEAKN